MTTGRDNSVVIALLITLILMAVLALGFVVGRAVGITEIRQQAVRSGNAKWVATEYGQLSFVWRDTP
jgi:hypothetical protein